MEKVQCRTSASIHLPHHCARCAPVRPFCTTGHAGRTSWLCSHHRQRAYPAVYGYTVGRRYPSTCPPTGCYHSTGLRIPKAMCQRNSFAYPVLPRLVSPCRGGRERSARSGADAFKPPRQLRWRTCDEPPGQTECQGPRGTLSGDELLQERPWKNSGQCPQGCRLPGPPA